MRSRASRIITLSPARLNSRAAARPAAPAPIIKTSVSSCMRWYDYRHTWRTRSESLEKSCNPVITPHGGTSHVNALTATFSCRTSLRASVHTGNNDTRRGFQARSHLSNHHRSILRRQQHKQQSLAELRALRFNQNQLAGLLGRRSRGYSTENVVSRRPWRNRDLDFAPSRQSQHKHSRWRRQSDCFLSR